ncbi:MAG: nucleotidyltransferase family protein [Bacteroidaceae bacterium]|nr:nucleotidyltransferase family protein [Bacteroidaceae bacterium]
MNSQDAFLNIVRLGISHYASCFKGDIDWNVIQALAEQQGLSAIIVDGVEQLPDNQRPPKELLLQWIGETLQGYEYRYDLYKRAIAELASFYNLHSYKMMLLKGYGCSLNWPKPEHRPCGDIDIWQFGQQKEADALLAKEKGKEIDNSHHHHSVFNWRDFMVENHYDFINVHHHKSNIELEKVFKELESDDSHFVDVNGEKVYLPSPNLNALFLLKHSMNDFTSFSMTLRQVLDWAFFVEKHTNEIDWEWLKEQLEKFHMKDFFNCINAICVEDLGFPVEIFKTVQFVPGMKERVLDDILCPSFTAAEPRGLIKRLVYKYRRWKGNEWKHQMCYNESRWSSFWYGAWGHLLKPKTI